MSRRLSRPHSTDSLGQCRSQPMRSHRVTFEDDYGYRSPTMTHQQDHGIQSEHHHYGFRQERPERGSRDTSRHVTWEHLEHTPDCPRHNQTSNNQMGQSYWDEPYASRGTQQYHQHTAPCPIHGYQNQAPLTNARPGLNHDYFSSYAAPSSYPLYDMSRPVTSSRTGYMPGEYEPNRRGAWHQRLMLPEERMSTHLRTVANHNDMYRIFSNVHPNIRSNLLPFSMPAVTSYNMPQLYRPKWRRSVVGLNRWSMWY